VLVNNAGIFKLGRVEETSQGLWDEIMDINAKGVFLGAKYAIPEMRKAGGGSIVNISSVAGLVGTLYSAAYGASKGAVRSFTKSIAIQYAKDGIQANSIHPGVIETPMIAPNLLATEESRQFSVSRHPLGQPEEVAYGALFLASDESSFMTGSELVIDGGLTAQ
jgi:NAD(P)-dependent dehydrogenase (short-subunit alcohol dehydrogenase family)